MSIEITPDRSAEGSQVFNDKDLKIDGTHLEQVGQHLSSNNQIIVSNAL
jgi:hypothetical protein